MCCFFAEGFGYLRNLTAEAADVIESCGDLYDILLTGAVAGGADDTAAAAASASGSKNCRKKLSRMRAGSKSDDTFGKNTICGLSLFCHQVKLKVLKK